MKSEVRDWFEAQSRWGHASFEEVVNAKGKQKVSVVLPARNEEETVGAIVEAIKPLPALVDEIVVIDSDSTDRTAQIASAAGATVFRQREILPELVPYAGKGEALWKSLHVTGGDLLVFLDADVREAKHGTWVKRLLEPLLLDEQIKFVKGSYSRPFAAAGELVEGGGGRVTHLCARPWLMWWPDLAGFVQPLAGEFAARREVLEAIPFPVRYGVDLAMLVDVYKSQGRDLAGMAQVDLERRLHRNQGIDDLGLMAAQIHHTMVKRLVSHGLIGAIPDDQDGPVTKLVQFRREEDEFAPRVRDVDTRERPPIIEIPEYLEERHRPHRIWRRFR